MGQSKEPFLFLSPLFAACFLSLPCEVGSVRYQGSAEFISSPRSAVVELCFLKSSPADVILLGYTAVEWLGDNLVMR